MKRRQGSKTKLRLTETIMENKELRRQRNQLSLIIAALVKKSGPITLKYSEVAQADFDDQVRVDFNRSTGVYTIDLKEKDNAEQLGSGSGEVGVPEREGDVGGPLPEAGFITEPADGEVREGDQHDPSED